MTSIDGKTGNITHQELLDEIGGEVGGGGLTNATAFTTETAPDPVTGDDMTVLVFPADQTVLAIKIEGDDFPRWIFTSDGGDGIYFGDGTYDPYNSGASFGAASGNAVFHAPSGGQLQMQDPVRATNGMILFDTNGDAHQLVVATDGTLSTTPG